MLRLDVNPETDRKRAGVLVCALVIWRKLAHETLFGPRQGTAGDQRGRIYKHIHSRSQAEGRGQYQRVPSFSRCIFVQPSRECMD